VLQRTFSQDWRTWKPREIAEVSAYFDPNRPRTGPFVERRRRSQCIRASGPIWGRRQHWQGSIVATMVPPEASSTPTIHRRTSYRRPCGRRPAPSLPAFRRGRHGALTATAFPLVAPVMARAGRHDRSKRLEQPDPW